MIATAIETHDVPYGPAHTYALEQLLGFYRVYQQAIYEQPARQGVACADGRWAILSTTQYGFSTHVTIYPEYSTYSVAWARTLDAVTDPEDGRRRGTCAGSRQAPVNGGCPQCDAAVSVFDIGPSRGLVRPH